MSDAAGAKALDLGRKLVSAERALNGNEGVFHGVTSDVTATTAHHRERQGQGGRHGVRGASSLSDDGSRGNRRRGGAQRKEYP